MKISGAFPSKYIKTADLQGKEVELSIDSVVVEDMGEDDAKPIMYFADRKKGLVLNRTNAQVIAASYGDETESWSGQKVVLYPAKVSFKGQLVDGLRIRIPAEQAANEEDIAF